MIILGQFSRWVEFGAEKDRQTSFLVDDSYDILFPIDDKWHFERMAIVLIITVAILPKVTAVICGEKNYWLFSAKFESGGKIAPVLTTLFFENDRSVFGKNLLSCYNVEVCEKTGYSAFENLF